MRAPMNLKSLTLGCVLGFVVAVVPACGSTTECDGCIGLDGKCVPLSASSSNSACGKGGLTCASCREEQRCDVSARVCINAESDGGTGTGGGAGNTGGGTGNTGGGNGGNGGGVGGGAGGGAVGPVRDQCNVTTGVCPDASEVCLMTTAGGSFGECFPGECQLTPSNCPTATSNCYAAAGPDGGVTVCLPEGAVDIGGACANAAACKRGLTCVNGECSQWCRTNGDCVNNGTCTGVVGLQGIPGLNVSALMCVYPDGCDVLTQQGCSTGESCYFSDPNGNTICVTTGSSAVGATCMGLVNDCVPGAMCATSDGTTLNCRQLCNADGGMPTCASGTCTLMGGVVHGCL